MDEPARRVLHRFKHGESVQQYRGEFGFIFITLSRTKNGEKRDKLVCDVLKISADIFGALTPVFLQKFTFHLASFGMIKFYVKCCITFYLLP